MTYMLHLTVLKWFQSYISSNSQLSWWTVHCTSEVSQLK